MYLKHELVKSVKKEMNVQANAQVAEVAKLYSITFKMEKVVPKA